MPPSTVYAVVTTADSRIALVRSIPSRTPKVEPMATSNSALQNSSPASAGRNSTAAQRFAEAGLERIDQRGEAEAAHDAGEEQAADDQADAEAEAALDAELHRRLVGAFGRAEQIAAVDPRRGHRESGDQSGIERPATIRSAAVPSRTFRDASQPTTMKAPYMATTASDGHASHKSEV